MNEEEYRMIKEKYNNGELIFSINLAKARKFLTELQYQPTLIIYCLIYLLLFGCCIYSFFVLKWFSYMGICSFSLEKAKINGVIEIRNCCNSNLVSIQFWFINISFFKFFGVIFNILFVSIFSKNID